MNMIPLNENNELRISVRKDGNNKMMTAFLVDKTKPRCYLEGDEYKFNSELLWQKLIRPKDSKEISVKVKGYYEGLKITDTPNPM